MFHFFRCLLNSLFSTEKNRPQQLKHTPLRTVHTQTGITGKALLILFLAMSSLNAQDVAESGVLDLRSFGFSESEPIPLNGEWEFYWKELIDFKETSREVEYREFPHMWQNEEELSSFGFASYRLKILLPKNYPALAFTIPDMYTAYSFYVDSVLIASNGVVGKTKETHVPKWVPRTIPLDQFNKESIEIVLHISNFEHKKGGARLPIYFGSEVKLVEKREKKLGYAFILTGSLIMGGLFFFGLYLFGRDEKPILYFSLFCICYSYRVFGTELYPLHLFMENVSWIITLKAEYITLYLSPVFFGLFVRHLYEEESSKKIIYGLNSFFLALAIIALLTPAYYFTQLINVFFSVMPIYILYASWVFFKAVFNRNESAKYAIASGIVIFMVFIHNLLEYFVIIQENLLLNLIGYMLFFFLQSLILSNRFGSSLRKAKEKAEQASIAKSQFLSTMGHELRTPLNAIIGFSELLADSKSNEDRIEFSNIIKKSGESLLGVINNILDFSKIDTGNTEIDFEKVQLEEFLKDTIQILSALNESNKVELLSKYSVGVEKHFMIDPVRLRQVLINLIGNALKFTEEGEIIVEVKEHKDSSSKSNLVFSIKDTGVGIPDDKMNLLFKEFSQIDSAKNRRYSGSGLGLAISKRLVHQMGGDIWVENNHTQGATFSFTIQAEQLKIVDYEKKELAPIVTDSKKSISRILLAEDNIFNQKVAEKMLERIGYEVEIVNNGFEAVEKSSNNEYDLILMDMEMPGLDGIEAARQILNNDTIKNKPVIISMTANVSPEDKERCLEAGMVDFISKPVTLEVLNGTIKKYLGG